MITKAEYDNIIHSLNADVNAEPATETLLDFGWEVLQIDSVDYVKRAVLPTLHLMVGEGVKYASENVFMEDDGTVAPEIFLYVFLRGVQLGRKLGLCEAGHMPT